MTRLNDDAHPAADAGQRAVRVGEAENVIVVWADNQRWVSLWRAGAEVSRESGGAPKAAFVVAPGDYLLRTDGILRSVHTEQRELPPPPRAAPRSETAAALRLSSDAPDMHKVDGVGEIPADGTSAVTITVDKTAAQGALPSPETTDEVFLRTTGGTIVDVESGTRIRSVRLCAGVATFRLISERSPRLVTVFAFTGDRLFSAELPIEFV